MTQRWIAVQSSHTAQGRVCLGLQDVLGPESVFMPQRVYWANFRHERHMRFEPLFVGYTFARILPDHLGDISEIDGVSGFVRNNGRMVFIPDETIKRLWQEWRGRLFDETRDYGLPEGTEVRITDGPFADLVGKIRCASPKQRPRLYIQLFNRVVETSVPIDKLERLEA